MDEARQTKCLDAFKGVVDPEITMARIRKMVEVFRKENPADRARSVRDGGGAGIYFPYGALMNFQRVIDELDGKEPEPEGPPPGVWACPHGSHHGYRPITAERNGMHKRSAGDLGHLRQKHHLGVEIIEARVCQDCQDTLPSVVKAWGKQKKESAAAAKKRLEEEIDRIAMGLAGEAELYRCEQCETIWDEDDLVPVRFCPKEGCEKSYDASDSGRNCEDCNRPFTRKLADKGCPDCIGDEEVEDCALLTGDKLIERMAELQKESKR